MPRIPARPPERSSATSPVLRTLLGSLSAVALACSPAERFESQRAEFADVARELSEGENPFFGQQRLVQARARLASAASSGQQIAASRQLAIVHLERGEVDAALDVLDAAFRLLGPSSPAQQRANLHRTRGLAHLRQAELENCIERNNADCCLFPLRDGGVHVSQEPARAAQADYRAYLELFPDDLGVRWLLNLAHMATGDHPAAVPEPWRIELAAPEGEAAAVGRFHDVAPALGLDVANLCGGVVVDDFDGDGWLDIVTSTSDPSGPLLHYRNRGDGGFADVSEASRTSDQLGGLNCIGGDYDSDGDVDLLVLRGAWMFDAGRIRNSLLANDGGGSFADVTREEGLAEPAYPTQAATFGDFDLDGRLDLFIGNESRMEQRGDGDFPSQLFHNTGAGFRDVAARAGVTNDRYCKGVSAGDYDNDGDLDLYVSNVGKNRLYRNESGLEFVDVAEDLGVMQEHRTFAPWFFDYDNDGWLDLFVASFQANVGAVAADYLGRPSSAQPPALLHNEGGRFRDVTVAAGLSHAYLPMGANFGDLDGDGWLDIYLATGDPSYETLTPNVALRNEGGARFADVTVAAGLGHLQKGHGVAFGDLDRDGDLDLFNQLGGFYPGDTFRNALFANPGHGNRFLVLVLEGTQSVRCGYGARVRVTVEEDGVQRELHRAVGSVSSFGGSPARLELGLGAAERVVEVEIRWPASGQVARLRDVPLDAALRIVEGESEPERLEYGAAALGASKPGG